MTETPARRKAAEVPSRADQGNTPTFMAQVVWYAARALLREPIVGINHYRAIPAAGCEAGKSIYQFGWYRGKSPVPYRGRGFLFIGRDSSTRIVEWVFYKNFYRPEIDYSIIE